MDASTSKVLFIIHKWTISKKCRQTPPHIHIPRFSKQLPKKRKGKNTVKYNNYIKYTVPN